jgi:predicted nucleic acid-binding protein
MQHARFGQSAVDAMFAARGALQNRDPMRARPAANDTSVLYPAPLRDLLLELAVSDLYRAKWSDAVHEEWITAVVENRPDLTRAQLERTRDLMNAHARDALVTDFEQLIDVLELPDPDDRHVLAAAIKGRADFIVTVNLRDVFAVAL